MRQTFRLAIGATLRGAQLPDGSGAAAVSIDNPSGYWYQVYPSGSFVGPYTTGYVDTFAALAPVVDIVAMPTGHAPGIADAAEPPVGTPPVGPPVKEPA